MKSRDYVEEILLKRSRLHLRTTRLRLLEKRVHGVVAMFRTAKRIKPSSSVRSEMMRASAIGYIACLEGYLRLVIADLINGDARYRANVAKLRDFRFRPEDVLALYDRRVSLGDYVAHLLPFNGLSDINAHFSTLIDQDFLTLVRTHPMSRNVTVGATAIDPNLGRNLQQLFAARHLFAHELATKVLVRPRNIERGISAAATFVFAVEHIVDVTLLPIQKAKDANRIG